MFHVLQKHSVLRLIKRKLRNPCCAFLPDVEVAFNPATYKMKVEGKLTCSLIKYRTQTRHIEEGKTRLAYITIQMVIKNKTGKKGQDMCVLNDPILMKGSAGRKRAGTVSLLVLAAIKQETNMPARSQALPHSLAAWGRVWSGLNGVEEVGTERKWGREGQKEVGFTLLGSDQPSQDNLAIELAQV